MQEAIPDSKQAKALLDADEAFTEAAKASRFVKKTVTDPTLRQPTKAGRAASGLDKDTDVSFRSAVNTLRKGSFSVKRNIDKAVELLEQFNRSQKLKKLGEQTGRSILFGGVAGGVGGRILRETER